MYVDAYHPTNTVYMEVIAENDSKLYTFPHFITFDIL